jgi:heat shock protein HslJ
VDGSSWKLQSLTRADSTVTTIGEPDRFTLAFGDNNRLSLRADCNNAFGGYSANGNSLSVGPLASTKAYCSSAPLDDEYLRAISGESTITVTSTTLTIASSRGTLQFRK